jgi:isopenicillin N synthase-like dioxygenase
MNVLQTWLFLLVSQLALSLCQTPQESSLLKYEATWDLNPEDNEVIDDGPTVGSPPDSRIPIIDVGPLYFPSFPNFYMKNTVEAIGKACREVGFFYITGVEGADQDLIDYQTLVAEARWFFNQSTEYKRKIDMSLGGSAWRGYFGVGDELTSGIPDQKEGLYFGTESNDTSKPLHGLNLYPTKPYFSEMDSNGYPLEIFHILLKNSVPLYMKAMKNIAKRLLQAIALSLDLDPNVHLNFTQPTELFRIFSYPPHNSSFGSESMGVGEHTDYGFLTILAQDMQGGLQVRDATTHEWINVQPWHNHYVVNLGDALEHYTGGLYRATPHRVVQRMGATHSRLSMPYFFDPGFDETMTNIVPQLSSALQEAIKVRKEQDEYLTRRWDKANPSSFQGKYGDYLLSKISKVFPNLFNKFVAGKDGERQSNDEL